MCVSVFVSVSVSVFLPLSFLTTFIQISHRIQASTRILMLWLHDVDSELPRILAPVMHILNNCCRPEKHTMPPSFRRCLSLSLSQSPYFPPPPPFLCSSLPVASLISSSPSLPPSLLPPSSLPPCSPSFFPSLIPLPVHSCLQLFPLSLPPLPLSLRLFPSLPSHALPLPSLSPSL